jgi:hypothetical protein
MLQAIPVERKALYYPWVHFHSDEWVKKALLVFPGMFRMVANQQLPNDSQLVYDLRSKGLIQRADLETRNSVGAQQVLRELIQQDLDRDTAGFIQRFGSDAALRSGQPSFQMNPGKAAWELIELLRRNRLLWAPPHPEHEMYVELHPDLGQAVLGTIAMACAEDAGLQVLGVNSPRGRDRSAELNSTLAAKDRTGPYMCFVRKETPAPLERPNADQLFHFMVHLNCDVSRLDAAAIVALHDEREPMRLLKERVEALALSIPEMKDPKRRQEALEQRANEIVVQWQADRMNLSKVTRELFALDAFAGGTAKLMEVLESKILPAGAGVLAGTSFAGVYGGIALGVVAHATASINKVRKAEKNSPWRYMTLAEEHGASFSLNTISPFADEENLALRR